MEENLKQQATDTIKIVLLCPDSAGKVALSNHLANYFDTVSVPEFTMEYLQDNNQKFCKPDDLLPIAIGQTQLENEALLTANQFLICNTSLLVTKVYSEIYFNYCDPILDKAAKKHKYDLFFLNSPIDSCDKVDFYDRPVEVHSFCNALKTALIENHKPFVEISGSNEERLEKIINIINELVKAKEIGFTSHNFVELNNKGIQIDTIKSHIESVEKGHSKSILVKPAIIDDGIYKIKNEDFISFSNYFDKKKSKLKLTKFVPASGAATRMFKFLNEFLEKFDLENETINAFINRKNASELAIFITGMDKFPFFTSVDKKLNELYPDFNSWDRDKMNYHFIKLLLTSEYYNFSNKPKGVLPFHKYTSQTVTPIEEHLKESVFYTSTNGISNVHFTISEAHQPLFESILEKVKSKIEIKHNTKINIEFSYQHSHTDTIALDDDCKPLLNENNQLIFRPAGHGALINNLNQLDSDIVFIKNIDNVCHNHVENTTLYKKSLAGLLIQLQEEIFKKLNKIKSKNITENDLNQIIDFIQNKLNHPISEDIEKYTFENKCLYVHEILNRPIRICGMVKNEGELGGGPFWTQDLKGNISLQIIESTQIDKHNPIQKQILKDSTHFNPVDLVCGIKDFEGNKFDLLQFVDHSAGFVVEKNLSGVPIKAYELPGLWNGGMAKWITLFVEVPLLTFNPVKTVNDLLKASHQSS
ncbi:MAG TPA: DUF4301 family protein [Flavobacterium sp.]|nr:DUF4301 family protein [Flavobacterium sp.]